MGSSPGICVPHLFPGQKCRPELAWTPLHRHEPYLCVREACAAGQALVDTSRRRRTFFTGDDHLLVGKGHARMDWRVLAADNDGSTTLLAMLSVSNVLYCRLGFVRTLAFFSALNAAHHDQQATTTTRINPYWCRVMVTHFGGSSLISESEQLSLAA